jgi:Holliday junction DNA helicase RuvA
MLTDIAQKGKHCYDVFMIKSLVGQVWHIEDKHIILMVNGVGYKVFVTSALSASLASSLSSEGKVTLWTYLAVRENALDLYGFESKEDLELFELLITVSGIGPKTAIGILSAVLPQTVRTAISSGETAYLTKVSGIGKKVAEKIVHELKGKFEGLEVDKNLQSDSDAVEALKSLGYSQNEAREALKKIDKENKEISTTSARVKAALKILGSSNK